MVIIVRVECRVVLSDNQLDVSTPSTFLSNTKGSLLPGAPDHGCVILVVCPLGGAMRRLGIVTFQLPGEEVRMSCSTRFQTDRRMIIVSGLVVLIILAATGTASAGLSGSKFTRSD